MSYFLLFYAERFRVLCFFGTVTVFHSEMQENGFQENLFGNGTAAIRTQAFHYWLSWVPIIYFSQRFLCFWLAGLIVLWILMVGLWLISGQDCDDVDREDIGQGFRENPVEPR
jgi:hypothetical protein